MANSILRIDASARTNGSYSRELTDRVIDRLATADTAVTIRDIGAAPPAIITEDWVNANFTPDESRPDAQHQLMANEAGSLSGAHAEIAAVAA